VRVDVITDDAGLAELAPDWDRLAGALGRPLASAAWLHAWWRHLAPEAAVSRVIVCRRGPDVVGVLPLFARLRGGLWRYATFGGADAAVGTWLVTEGGAAETVRATAAALRRLRPGVASLALTGLSETDDASLGLARRWPAVRLGRRSEVAPALDAHPEGFSAWMAGKSRNFRKSTGQSRRRLEREGARIVRASGSAAVEQTLAAFHRLHADRWGTRSPLSPPGALAALREVAAPPGGRRRLRAWSLVGPLGEIAAVELVLCAGDTELFWTGGWDEAWTRFSPSTTLLLAALEDAHTRGVHTVDLGPGNQEWKRRFADRTRTLSDVALLPVGWRGTVVAGSTLVGAGLRRARAVAANVGRG
jgi:CelD/BcsL family acetyltransferase involved in cellulose biosynthesis